MSETTERLDAIETAIQLLSANVMEQRTQLLAVKAMLNEQLPTGNMISVAATTLAFIHSMVLEIKQKLDEKPAQTTQTSLVQAYRQLALDSYAFADCIDGLLERRFRDLDTRAKEAGVPEITPLAEDDLYRYINDNTD